MDKDPVLCAILYNNQFAEIPQSHDTKYKQAELLTTVHLLNCDSAPDTFTGIVYQKFTQFCWIQGVPGRLETKRTRGSSFNFNTKTPAEPYSGINAERAEINWEVTVDDLEASPWMKEPLLLKRCLH